MRANTLSPVSLEVDSIDVGGDPLEVPLTNLLINGNFNVWQRGQGPTTLSAVDYQGPDRWLTREIGSGSPTIEKFSSVDLAGGAALIKTVDTSSKYLYLFQRIEAINIIPYIGETLLLGCWVWSTLAQKIIVQAYANDTDATADDWGTDFLDYEYLGDAEIDVEADAWQWVEWTFTVPDSAKRGLMVGFGTPDSMSTVEEIYFKEARLHIGTTRLPDHLTVTRSIEEEFALCQRYYQNWTGSPILATVYNASYIRLQRLNYLTTMRTTPTITISNPTWLPASGGSWGTIGAIYGTGAYGKYGVAPIYNTSGGTVGFCSQVSYDLIADAEL